MVKPRIKNRKRLGSRQYKNYTSEMLELAKQYVREKNMSSRQAELNFGIPRRTILYYRVVRQLLSY